MNGMTAAIIFETTSVSSVLSVASRFRHQYVSARGACKPRRRSRSARSGSGDSRFAGRAIARGASCRECAAGGRATRAAAIAARDNGSPPPPDAGRPDDRRCTCLASALRATGRDSAGRLPDRAATDRPSDSGNPTRALADLRTVQIRQLPSWKSPRRRRTLFEGDGSSEAAGWLATVEAWLKSEIRIHLKSLSKPLELYRIHRLKPGLPRGPAPATPTSVVRSRAKNGLAERFTSRKRL